jgi:hypothetical protein
MDISWLEAHVVATVEIVMAASLWILHGEGFNDGGDDDKFNGGGDSVVGCLLVQVWVVLLVMMHKVYVVRVL